MADRNDQGSGNSLVPIDLGGEPAERLKNIFFIVISTILIILPRLVLIATAIFLVLVALFGILSWLVFPSQIP